MRLANIAFLVAVVAVAAAFASLTHGRREFAASYDRHQVLKAEMAAADERYRALADEVAALRSRVGRIEAASEARDRKERMAAFRDAAPWVPSRDGKVAVRLWADSDRYSTSAEKLHLGMEVKNTSDKPLVVSDPEILWHTALLEITGPQGKLNYRGPQIMRPPPRPVTVAPGGSAQRVQEVYTGNHVGLNHPGRYRLTYHYHSNGKDVTWSGSVLVGVDFEVVFR